MKTRYIVALSMLAGVAVGALALQGLHAQAKLPVYFVVENEISDVQSYLKEYAARARDMIKANGGRYLAAGDATTFVGEPPKSRVAIFVFDDLQQIQTWLTPLSTRSSGRWARSTPNSATTPFPGFHSRVKTVADAADHQKFPLTANRRVTAATFRVGRAGQCLYRPLIIRSVMEA